MTNDTFKESHLRGLYHLLGHKDLYSRIGSLDVATGTYDNRIVKDF